MWEFIGALVAGIVTLFTQQGINEKNWYKQNEYNENMYNKYASPQAQAEQLAATGMSDAGIGAALSGGNYAPAINLTSSPLENAQVPDVSSLFKNITSGKLDKSEISLNKTKETINNLTARELRKNIEKAGVEINMLKVQHDISLQEFNILRHSANWLIKLNDVQLKQECVKLANMYVELATSMHNKDIAKYNADLARFKDEFLKKAGIPYEDLDTNSPFKVIGIMFKLLGGESINFDDVFKDFNYGDDLNMDIYQDRGKYYN